MILSVWAIKNIFTAAVRLARLRSAGHEWLTDNLCEFGSSDLNRLIVTVHAHKFLDYSVGIHCGDRLAGWLQESGSAYY